jgi:hypothetical protein
MTGPILPPPIPSFLLDDVREAAQYLEELGEAPDTRVRDIHMAHKHSRRLWSAAQAVERLLFAVEQMKGERPRRTGNGNT